jgi:hypothetical protein
MTTGLTSNYNATRDQIITRALRIVHSLGDGEAPDNDQLNQAIITLAQVTAEFNTDGMPVWNLNNYTITPVQGQASYTISAIGGNLVAIAPLKIIQGWMHDLNTFYDTPMIIIPQADYNLLGNKTSQGTPNQLWYKVPPAIQGTGESVGTVTVYPVPDAYTAANKQLVLVGQKPFSDFDAAGDTLDFPPHFINALTWGLADQLAYENALPFAERSMISKKAQFHRDAALSFSTEEGYIQFRPGAQYG